MPKGLTKICYEILNVIKRHPEGITAGKIRDELGLAPDQQSQLDRRRRQLYSHYEIQKNGTGQETRYVYVRDRVRPLDTANISEKDRFRALYEARGRCGVCGQTVEKHGITLVVDHRIPRDWGGKTEPDNLWAICEPCNRGKKNFFKTVDSAFMKKVMGHKSVRIRIGETLKAFNGDPVQGQLLEFVANRDDWKKRTRDLRYLGWKIKVTKRKIGERVRSFYAVQQWKPWPDDPDAVVSKYERDRARRNKGKAAKP